MDLLRQEIAKKWQRLKGDTGGKTTFKRSEIKQKEIQKLREQEKRELEAKAQRHQQANPNPNAAPADKPNSSSAAASTETSAASKPLTDEQNIDKLDLPKPEVVRRLRILKQPVTLFGEDDSARLDRLKHVLKTSEFEVDSDVTSGQTRT